MLLACKLLGWADREPDEVACTKLVFSISKPFSSHLFSPITCFNECSLLATFIISEKVSLPSSPLWPFPSLSFLLYPFQTLAALLPLSSCSKSQIWTNLNKSEQIGTFRGTQTTDIQHWHSFQVKKQCRWGQTLLHCYFKSCVLSWMSFLLL